MTVNSYNELYSPIVEKIRKKHIGNKCTQLSASKEDRSIELSKNEFLTQYNSGINKAVGYDIIWID